MKSNSKWRLALNAIFVVAAPFLLLVGCPGDDDNTGLGPGAFQYNEPWPADTDALMSFFLEDDAYDQIAKQAGPAYGPVEFLSIDLTEVSLGIDQLINSDGDTVTFLYMRVEFVGAIPDQPVHILPDTSGTIEDQFVKNQGMNIALNTDDNMGTGGGGEGVSGIDIFFAVNFEYGVRAQIYANFGFAEGDLHIASGQIEGELGEGGSGYDYAVVRYKVSEVADYFPLGVTVDIGSWSEAESFNADGTLKYHHFAFDRLPGDTTWFVPTQ